MKTLARIISYITNPVFILAPIPYLLILKAGYNQNLALKWTLFSLYFLAVIGLLVVYEVKNRVFSDFDVSRRKQRQLFFIIIWVASLVYFLSLIFFRAPFILFVSTFGAIFGISVASLINTKIKMSLHVATLTAVLFTIIELYELSPFLFLLIPVVGWARMKIRRHSFAEVIIGFIFGVALPLVMYILLKYLYNYQV